jgi:hypothetical protein
MGEVEDIERPLARLEQRPPRRFLEGARASAGRGGDAGAPRARVAPDLARATASRKRECGGSSSGWATPGRRAFGRPTALLATDAQRGRASEVVRAAIGSWAPAWSGREQWRRAWAERSQRVHSLRGPACMPRGGK